MWHRNPIVAVCDEHGEFLSYTWDVEPEFHMTTVSCPFCGEDAYAPFPPQRVTEEP